MAIQVAYTDGTTKLALPTAYCKILSITIDAVDLTIDVAIGIYANAAARTAGGQPLIVLHGWPPFNALMNGPIDVPASAYNYVKTLPMFAGAVDVA